MKASQTRSLGAAASALAAATFDNIDYTFEADCNGLIGGAQSRAYDAVAVRFGFRNRFHLLAAIERRTSARWVHFNFGFFC